MKFDVVLSNPPYNNGLYQKFCERYFNICTGEICWVSPLSFLLGKKQTKSITSQMDLYKSDIAQINGNDFFDAAIAGTIGVVYIDMSNNHQITFNGKEYNKCEEIRFYSNDVLLMEFKSVIEKLVASDNMNNHVYAAEFAENVPYVKQAYNGYVSRIDLFAGSGSIGPDGDSFYTLFSKNRTVNDNIGMYNQFIDLKDKFKLYIPFNTKNEAINFYNYCKTYFCRCSLFFNKTNLHLDRGEMKFIPWFDFSDPLFNDIPENIDISLFKKYKIRDDVVTHILEVLPNYYELNLNIY